MSDSVAEEAKKILADLWVLPGNMLSVEDLMFLNTMTRWSRKGPWTVGEFDEYDLEHLKDMHEAYSLMKDE